MIRINPAGVLCDSAAQAFEAIKADKESAAVVALIDTDAEMIELNTAITKEANLTQGAAVRFDRPAEFWQIGASYAIDADRWKSLVMRKNITLEQIQNMKTAAAMQQMAMAAASGGGGPPPMNPNGGRRR